MAKMLCRDCLTLEERVYLANLSTHPGFAVMIKLMEDACSQATKKTIALDPEDPNYDSKLKVRHLEARIMNDFAASVIASCRTHVEALEAEVEENQDVAKLVESLKR